MCRFCENGKVPNLKSENMNVEVYLNDNQLIIETYGYDTNMDSDVEINYCPVCGRQLKETLIDEKILLGI